MDKLEQLVIEQYTEQNLSIGFLENAIGNPVFAIETLLDPIRKRIKDNRLDEALLLINHIQLSLEKIKNVLKVGEHHEIH